MKSIHSHILPVPPSTAPPLGVTNLFLGRTKNSLLLSHVSPCSKPHAPLSVSRTPTRLDPGLSDPIGSVPMSPTRDSPVMSFLLPGESHQTAAESQPNPRRRGHEVSTHSDFSHTEVPTPHPHSPHTSLLDPSGVLPSVELDLAPLRLHQGSLALNNSDFTTPSSADKLLNSVHLSLADCTDLPVPDVEHTTTPRTHLTRGIAHSQSSTPTSTSTTERPSTPYIPEQYVASKFSTAEKLSSLHLNSIDSGYAHNASSLQVDCLAISQFTSYLEPWISKDLFSDANKISFQKLQTQVISLIESTILPHRESVTNLSSKP